MSFEVNQKVMVHMPVTACGIPHAKELRKFNRKVATITVVTPDYCKINLDDGKYEWPHNALAAFLPYGEKGGPKMEFDIRAVKNYFEIYFEDMFVSCADTHAEAENDIEELKKEIEKVGFSKWRADFYNMHRKLQEWKESAKNAKPVYSMR